MPKLRQLEYLVALADARTFREAARACHVTQPTLTQQIQTLERRLGTVLVKRHTNPVELTPIGREVLRRARRVLGEVAGIRSLAQAGGGEAGRGVAGIVRLGISPTIGPYLMPGVVADLHRSHPDLRLHLAEGTQTEQLAALRRGELDILVASGSVGGKDLVIEPLFAEPLQLVAAPDHPLALAGALPPERLRGEEVIGLGTGHALQAMIVDICAEYDMRLEYDYQGSSLDSICQMVASGLGMAILPELYLRSAVGGRTIVRRLAVAGWRLDRAIVAVRRRDFGGNAPDKIAAVMRRAAHAILDAD